MNLTYHWGHSSFCCFFFFLKFQIHVKKRTSKKILTNRMMVEIVLTILLFYLASF